MWWIIVTAIWIIGIFVTYFAFTKNWKKDSKVEQIYFAIIWPLLIPLYIIHFFHNFKRLTGGEE